MRSVELLSIVAPVFNESASLRALHARIAAALGETPYELVLVDDGSTDDSLAVLRELAAEDPRVRVIVLSRNFGHQLALTAGLDAARGDAIVMIDADLQDPPEVIPDLLAQWEAGFDVVGAVREERAGETWFKLRSAEAFYRLLDWLASIPVQRNAGDFRLLDRRALDALLSMRERSRFLRGMSSWVGFSQTTVTYRREARQEGATHYTLAKMVRLSFDAISSFSGRPLQLATLLGFVVSAFALIAIPVVVVLKIIGSYLPGFSTVEISLLLLGGIQLITIGIIGEYLARIFDEVKQRPLYLVSEEIGAGAPESSTRSPR